jgi:hypothetical protein
VHGYPGGDDSGPRPEGRDYAGHASPVSRRGQRDDGAAAQRAPGAQVEIRLPTSAGVEAGAKRIGTHLAGEIYLEGSVDGHHLVLLADHERIVQGKDPARSAEILPWVHRVFGNLETWLREHGHYAVVATRRLFAAGSAGRPMGPSAFFDLTGVWIEK